MEKELEEAKKKVIEKYKSSDNFIYDIAEDSLDIFHEEFEDYKNKIKKLFSDIDTALLIPSIAIQSVEETIEVQDVDVPIETFLPTIFEATTIAEALETPADAKLGAPTDQVVEVLGSLHFIFIWLPIFMFPLIESLRDFIFVKNI